MIDCFFKQYIFDSSYFFRYDPANPEDVDRLEFVTNPIPGHFWKVSAGSNGMVWALNYDMTVWAYLLDSRKTPKLEGKNALKIVVWGDI